MIPEDVMEAIELLKKKSYQIHFQTRVNSDSLHREIEWYGSIVTKDGRQFNTAQPGFSQMVIDLHNKVKRGDK